MDGPLPDPNLGVFETMLVLDGRPVELDAHLERLDVEPRRAVRASRCPRTRATSCSRRPATPALGRLRLDVSPAQGNAVRVADVDEAIVFPSFEQRARAGAWWRCPGGIGAHKWADRRLLEQAESDAGAASPLILDADDDASSRAPAAASSWCATACCSTPPADGRLLPGVTRARVIELAAAAGIEVRAGGAGPRAPARGRRGLHDRGRARRGAGRGACADCASGTRASSRRGSPPSCTASGSPEGADSSYTGSDGRRRIG